MYVSELIEGTYLMVLGMGSVFIFLTLLVLALHGVAYLSRRIARSGDYDNMAQPVIAPSSTADDEIIAVISAAIRRFRGHG